MPTTSSPASKPLAGTFLYPGVSLNKRLYTKALIGKAVARMRARIDDPDGLPIVMRTHHGAGDNSRLIVGRITAVNQETDGRGTYQARWYDTAPARDLAALVQPADGGSPGLRSVSIFGWFHGEHDTQVDGETVSTADDLEIDAIDFTATPGVVQALIDPSGAARPTESARAGLKPISETWETPVATAAAPEQSRAVPMTGPVIDEYSAQQMRDMADTGQAMRNDKGEPSFPIKTKSDLRKAIRAVGRGGSDHDKIRAHIIARAKALNLTSMVPDNWNADGSLKDGESIGSPRFGEIREYYPQGPDGQAGICVDAYNGPVSLTLRAVCIEPADLRAIAAAAIGAACDALRALDPDMDADIDVPGAPAEDTDDDADDLTDAADDDADDQPPAPGAGCACGCGCAVPHPMAGGAGCPCGCGCDICGADEVASESVAPPAPKTSTPQAPEVNPPVEESAVSETVIPAAEAATTSTESAGAQPAAATTSQAAAPLVVTFTQEQFRDLLSAIRPPATETAGTAAPAEPVAAEQPAVVEPEPQPEPATNTESNLTKADLREAVRSLIPDLVSQYGLPPRKGLRATESEQGEQKDPTPQELWDRRADVLLGDFGKVTPQL